MDFFGSRLQDGPLLWAQKRQRGQGIAMGLGVRQGLGVGHGQQSLGEAHRCGGAWSCRGHLLVVGWWVVHDGEVKHSVQQQGITN